jgi:hypothetical protein
MKITDDEKHISFILSRWEASHLTIVLQEYLEMVEAHSCYAGRDRILATRLRNEISKVLSSDE